MKFPLLARAVAVAAVAFVVLFPIKLIEHKIAERRAVADQVVAQFAAETSGPQVVAGPLLALTCEEAFTEERQVMRAGKAETVIHPQARQGRLVGDPYQAGGRSQGASTAVNTRQLTGTHPGGSGPQE